ncbi:MAG: LTA synthase family protein [Defluviitaleaceae bacterium]|nr:LTA synthase family protein [Defluviitaleaceae bacterium]
MKIIKNLYNRIRTFRLNLWQALAFISVLSLLLTLFLFLLQPLPFSYVVRGISASRGLSLLLNWLPLLLAALFLYFAGAGAVSAVTIVGAAAIILGYANRTKILLRNDPLVPWDMVLGHQVLGVARSFDTLAITLVAVVAIVYIAAAAFAAFTLRSQKIGVFVRAAGMAVCLLLAVALNRPLYNNTAITARLPVVSGNIWSQVNQYNSRGFVFSFINAFNTNKVMRPEDYNPAAVVAKIAASAASPLVTSADDGGNTVTNSNFRVSEQRTPHIIMIMGEAFSTISEHFSFEGFDEPLANWKALADESIQGEIVVSVMGGGTAQTEFDVLTGLNSRQFAGVPFAFRMITAEFESFASVLNSLGYRSEFMHPGYDWYYNRQNVYKHLGFSRLVFLDEFDDIPAKGMYVNEHDTINRTIEMFEQHLENFPDTPYFNFTVTIQNHGPYVDKYLYDGPVSGANFSTDLELAEPDINALSNFFHGLRDADAELGRLVEYLNTLDEPVVLVYFGDHNPALSMPLYDMFMPEAEQDSRDSIIRLFRLPFMVFLNTSAGGALPLSSDSRLVGMSPRSLDGEVGEEKPLFSASFLGAYVLELLGITGVSPFWDFNAELRRSFPVITESRSFSPDGVSSAYMTDEQRAPLLLYRDWAYYKIFEE